MHRRIFLGWMIAVVLFAAPTGTAQTGSIGTIGSRSSQDSGEEGAGRDELLLVSLVQVEGRTECHVNGERLVARPGSVDEVFEQVLGILSKKSHRVVEIDTGSDVPFGDLVSTMSSIVRVREASRSQGIRSRYSEFRLRIPIERTSTLRQRVRLVRQVRVPFPEKQVLIPLPVTDVSQAVPTKVLHSLDTINVSYHDARKEIIIGRRVLTDDHVEQWLKTIVRTKSPELRVLLRADKRAPAREILEVLAMMAKEDVKHVLLEVYPPTE